VTHGGETAPRMGGDTSSIRLSEVVAALSYALDLTEGEPPGHAVRSCLIGMRLAQELELDATTRSDLFYALLLKDAGCSANSARMAALFGADDHVAKRTSKRINWSGKLPAFLWSVRTVTPRGTMRDRALRLRAIKDEGEVTRSLMRARCDRGAEIALLVGLSAETAEAIRALDEHWDGRGQPRGLRGEEIPLLGRILCLAQTVEIFHADGGVPAAWAMARKRRGGWFDPSLVEALGVCLHDVAFCASLGDGDVSEWEPEDRLLRADDARLDSIATAFAGVIDAKSPWTYQHSDRASLIAVSLATALDAGADTLGDIRRAALLHDVGKLAISNRILDKPAGLDADEVTLMHRHPLFTAQILERVPHFRHLAPMASAHHERLDGSGYPRGLTGQHLDMPTRVLAVADVYEAVTSERPYRPAMSSGEALAILQAEVPTRLDADAVTALAGLLGNRDGFGDAFRATAVLGGG
jgi:HD-GYP domain-containing protein (c-di-GMP phosphodiesterase class II)